MKNGSLVIEQYRIRSGKWGSDQKCGNNGAFLVPSFSGQLRVIASDQEGWEHVSVSLKNRCPNWREMCQIKELFWYDDECVIQYHPPKKQYVNHHPYTLHMWKPIGIEFPTPPTFMIGPMGEHK